MISSEVQQVRRLHHYGFADNEIAKFTKISLSDITKVTSDMIKVSTVAKSSHEDD